MDEVMEPLDTILTLPTGTSAADIARGCREAAMEFINNSKHWGKPELGMWLTASYSPLTTHAANEVTSTVWPVPLLRDIDARLIGRIMQSARAEILQTLAQIATD